MTVAGRSDEFVGITADTARAQALFRRDFEQRGDNDRVELTTRSIDDVVECTLGLPTRPIGPVGGEGSLR